MIDFSRRVVLRRDEAAFYVLAGIAVFGAVVAAVFTESHSRVADAEPAEEPVFAEAA